MSDVELAKALVWELRKEKISDGKTARALDITVNTVSNWANLRVETIHASNLKALKTFCKKQGIDIASVGQGV